MEDNTRLEKIIIVTTGVISTLVLSVLFVELWVIADVVVTNLTAVLIK